MSKLNSTPVIKNNNTFCIELMAPTRFSSKPIPPNTFLNFQAGPKTPGFVSESDRLIGKRNDMNATLGFQREDKERKNILMQARAESKRNHLDNLMQKINDYDSKKETF